MESIESAEHVSAPTIVSVPPRFTAGQIREVAVEALGAISAQLFQPGGVQHICDKGRVPDHDWLVMRDGRIIGYGELATMYAEAVAEAVMRLESRA